AFSAGRYGQQGKSRPGIRQPEADGLAHEGTGRRQSYDPRLRFHAPPGHAQNDEYGPQGKQRGRTDEDVRTISEHRLRLRVTRAPVLEPAVEGYVLPAGQEGTQQPADLPGLGRGRRAARSEERRVGK